MNKAAPLFAAPLLFVSSALADTGADRCPKDMILVGSVCVDRYEWPNRKGSLPTIGVSAQAHPQDTETLNAFALCKSVHKRMCSIREWRAACAGTPKDNCNIHKSWRKVDWGKVSQRDPEHMKHLDQRDRSGSHSDCVSSAGVFDTIGSAEELVSCSGPHGVCQVGGYWASPHRTCSGSIVKHGAIWHGYHTGFRCCATLAPVALAPTLPIGVPFGAEAQPAIDTALIERVLWRKLETEAPSARKSEEWQRYIRGMARYASELGRRSVLIGSNDPFFIAGIAWHECRFRLECEGDGNFGPMQLNDSAPRWLPNVDAKWKGVTREQLEDPRTNIEAGYDVLFHHKKLCGKGPLEWITAYRSGRCHSPDANARMRWRTIKELIAYAEAEIPSERSVRPSSPSVTPSFFAASLTLPRVSTSTPRIWSLFRGGPGITSWPLDSVCDSIADQRSSLSIHRYSERTFESPSSFAAFDLLPDAFRKAARMRERASSGLAWMSAPICESMVTPFGI